MGSSSELEDTGSKVSNGSMRVWDAGSLGTDQSKRIWEEVEEAEADIWWGGGGEQRNGETDGSLRAGGAQRSQTGKGRGKESQSTLRRRRKHLSPTCLAGEKQCQKKGGKGCRLSRGLAR